MKITLLKSLLLTGAFLCLGMAQAQEVTGTVSDALGPLPGASVVVKGTTNGTQTDFDGNYTITVDEADAILVFSYIGYKKQEIAVAGQTAINATLEEDTQALDEVVLVGYGSQAKKEITSSVVSVGIEEFNQGVVASPAGLLQGKVAGLIISNPGGNPNASPTIRLRGISTVGGNQEPLVVVDGVLGGSLDNVDPADISNITVLKDGSAAAIYGSRASAGVIVVTTKTGKIGPLQVGYNGQLGVSTIENQIEIMNRDEFLAAGGNDLGSDTDWRDEVTQTGIQQVHNISAAGGTEDFSFRASANFRDTESIAINQGFQQANFRANFNGKLFDDKLKITINTAFTTRESQVGFDAALRYATSYNPTAPIFGDDAPFPFNSAQFGGYFETLGLFDSFNPVSIAEQLRNDRSATTLNYNINLDYKLSDAITLNVNYAEQDFKENADQYFPTTALFDGGNALSPTRRGEARFRSLEETFTLFEAFASYNNNISDFANFTVTGGYSFQESNGNGNSFTVGDFPAGVDFDFSNRVGDAQDLLEAGRINVGSGRQDGDRIIRFFGRLNATFDDAIYFNAAIAREGSSRFGSENQWGIFPAVSVGADLNKYLQLKNVNLFKARLGWGLTGANPPFVGLDQQVFNVQNGADGQSGASTTQAGGRAANPDLKWEEKSEINFGIEFATDRFGATFDIFSRDVDDFILLSNVEASEFNGFSQRWENAGRINVTGVEFAANYDVIRKENFTYNTGIVFGQNRNKLEENAQGDQVAGNLGSPGQNNTNVVLIREGEEIGQIWGPRWTGRVDASGTPILADINGDGNLVTGQGSALAEDADFAVLGSGLPDAEIGWTNKVDIGNWDFNVFFRAVIGHSLVNSFRAFYEPIIGSQASYNFVNTVNANPAIKTAQFSDYYVEKADFLRLDNMAIGYNFDLKESSYIKSLRLSLAGQNLFTITGYDGVNPEIIAADNGDGALADINQRQPNPLVPGIERRDAYFTARTFTLGLNINF